MTKQSPGRCFFSKQRNLKIFNGKFKFSVLFWFNTARYNLVEEFGCEEKI